MRIALVSSHQTPSSSPHRLSRHPGLIEVGRKEEGHDVLRRLHGEEYATLAVMEIEQAIELEHATAVKGFKACFAKYVLQVASRESLGDSSC